MTVNNSGRIGWDYLELLAGAPPQFRYVPVNGTKQPTGGLDWNKHPLTLEELNKLNPEAAGLLLGPVSGGIVDIDFDGPGSSECFERELGHCIDELPKTIQWSSGKPERGHRIYRVPLHYYPLIKHQRRVYKVDSKILLELRYDNHMSVIAGTHPETGQYYFEEGSSPLDIEEVPVAPQWLLEPLIEVKTHKKTNKLIDKQKEIELARIYLSRIDPLKCTDYETWLKGLMSLHSVSETMLGDAITWSSKMPNFDEEECRLKWKSFKPDGGIGIGTLKYISETRGVSKDHPITPTALQHQEFAETTDGQSAMSAVSAMDVMGKIASKHHHINEFAQVVEQVVAQYGTTDYVPYLLKQASTDFGLGLTASEINHFINKAVQSLNPAKEPIHGGEIVPVESAPWLLEDIILLSTVNLLVALPKVGKSSFIVSLIAAYLNGEKEYIGKAFHKEEHPVLIIGTDQPDSDWMRMLKRGGLIDSSARLHQSVVALYTTSRPLYFDENGLKTIEDWCKKHEQLIIIVDSYSRVAAPLGKEEKSEQFALALIELAKRIAPYDATAIVIHHSNKFHPESSTSLQSRGTTALPAVASQILSLSRESTSGGNHSQEGKVISYCKLKGEGRAGAPLELMLKSCSKGWELASSTEVGNSKRASNGNVDDEHEALSYISYAWNELDAGVSARSLANHFEWHGEAGIKRARRLLEGMYYCTSIDKTTVSRGFGGGAPTQVYVPTGLSKDKLKIIKDIGDIKDIVKGE